MQFWLLYVWKRALRLILSLNQLAIWYCATFLSKYLLKYLAFILCICVSSWKSFFCFIWMNKVYATIFVIIHAAEHGAWSLHLLLSFLMNISLYLCFKHEDIIIEFVFLTFAFFGAGGAFSNYWNSQFVLCYRQNCLFVHIIFCEGCFRC